MLVFLWRLRPARQNLVALTTYALLLNGLSSTETLPDAVYTSGREEEEDPFALLASTAPALL